MGLDNFQRLQERVRRHLLVWLAVNNILIIGLWWVGSQVLKINSIILLIVSVALAMSMSILITKLSTAYALEPLNALWRTILHLSPTDHGVAPPKPEDLKVGRELVASLSN